MITICLNRIVLFSARNFWTIATSCWSFQFFPCVFCHDFAILFVMFDLLGYDQLSNFQQCQLTVDGFDILHHQKDA